MTDIVSRDPAQNLASWDSRHGDTHSFDSSPDPFDGRRIVARLLGRKFQIFAVGLIVVIPAAIATYLATPLYRSTALLQVDADPVQVLPYRDIADFPAPRPITRCT